MAIAATQGLIIKTTNGNAIQNPLIGIANKAHNDMVRYVVEFGMTPSARSRIQVGKAQSEDDVASQFLDRPDNGLRQIRRAYISRSAGRPAV
jgi:P27 family predicted phage terminase small subunit